MRIRWYGLDYGETVMNPFTLHQSALIRAVYTRLGKPEEVEEHVRRWYTLRDEVGSKYDKLDLRVREVKQYSRERIYSEVLDGDSRAARLFEEGEAEGFTPAPGVKDALTTMAKNGVPLAIVSESSSRPSVDAMERFLRVHGLRDIFRDVITPAGHFDRDGKLISTRFLGKTKRGGSIYEELALYLRERGIRPSEAAVVGDDPVLDVENAKSSGFIGVQYIGIVDRGASKSADYVMRDWSEIPKDLPG